MGLLDITGSSETVSESETDASATAPDERGGRRWGLVVAAIVVLAVVAYLVSRQRLPSEAEFTEIELEPAASEAESESESTS